MKTAEYTTNVNTNIKQSTVRFAILQGKLNRRRSGGSKAAASVPVGASLSGACVRLYRLDV